MAFQVSPRYLKTVAQLESGGDPLAQNPNSTATGLYQFTDPVAAQYNLSDPTDPAASTDAMKALTTDNYAALSKALGRAPTEPELYLAHQQGATGAAKILSNPDAPAVDILGKKQVLNNGGNVKMTGADFANMWQGKYNKVSGFSEPDPIAGGVKVASSGQIASDAPFGAGDEPVGFGQGDEVVSHAAAHPPINDKFSPDTGAFRTAIDNFNQGTMQGWGGEVTDPLGAFYAAMKSNPMAALKGEVSDPALANQIIDMRANNQQNLSAGREENPLLAGGSQIAGALTSLPILSKVIPSGVAARAAAIAKAAPNLTAGAIGGGSSVINSLGEAQGTGLDRFDNVGMHDLGGVAGGIIGGKLARTAGNVVGALKDRFGGVLGSDAEIAAAGGNPPPPPPAAGAVGLKNPPPVTDLTPMKMAGILDEDSLANLQQGRVLPMTAGQRSQDVATQRMEQVALKSGSKPMQAALSQQQTAAAKPLQSILGGNQQMDPLALNGRTQDEMTGAANILRNQYDTLGNKVNAAYTAARQGANGVAIDAGSIKNDFMNNVTNTLADENVVKGDIPKLDQNLGELQSILNPVDEAGNPTGNVTALKLDQLEAWKKRLNRTMANTMEPADQRIVKMVGRHYDEFLGNLANDAIIGGDTTAIDAFKNARSLAAQKFRFYDSDNIVQKILDNRELSGTQLVNTMLGTTRMIGKGDDGRIVETMLDHAGEQAPQMLDSMRKGVVAKVLGDSLSPTIDPSTVGTTAERNLIDFGKMKKSLGSLMQQRETFNALFSPEEQAYFKNFYKDVSTIASHQSGAVNNSSTGSYMADMVSGIGKIVNNPLLKNVLGVGAVTSLVQEGLQKQAAAIVTGKAEAGLGEFLAKSFNAADAKATLYGGYMGGRAVDPIGKAMAGGQQ